MLINKIEKTVTRIEKLNERYPGSEEIAVRLARSLVNLTAEQGSDEIVLFSELI